MGVTELLHYLMEMRLKDRAMTVSADNMRPLYTVRPDAPGFVIFGSLLLGLLLLTGAFLLRRDKFSKSTSSTSEDDGLTGPGLKVVQRGFRHTRFGQTLYYSWCLLTASIQLILLLLFLGFFGQAEGSLQWLTNGLFDLKICTSDMLEQAQLNPSLQLLLPKYCTGKIGPSSAAFAFVNIGVIFISFWILALVMMYALMSEGYGQKIRLLFFTPSSLQDAEYVFLEEWTPRDTHTTSSGSNPQLLQSLHSSSSSKGRKKPVLVRGKEELATIEESDEPTGDEATQPSSSFNNVKPSSQDDHWQRFRSARNAHSVKLIDWRLVHCGGNEYAKLKRQQEKMANSPRNALSLVRAGYTNENNPLNLMKTTLDINYGSLYTNKNDDSNNSGADVSSQQQAPRGRCSSSLSAHLHSKGLSQICLEALTYAQNAGNSTLLGSEERNVRFFWFQCQRYLLSEEEFRFKEPADEYLGHWSTGALRDVYENFWEGGSVGVHENDDNIGLSRSSSVGRLSKFNSEDTGICDNGEAGPVGNCRKLRIYRNSTALSRKKQTIFGQNEITVEVPPLRTYIAAEFLDFITMLQFQSLWAPTFFTNWLLAVFSGGMFVIFGLLNAWTTRENQIELQKMASSKANDKVTAYYYDPPTGGYVTRRTRVKDLVPGDVIELTNDMTIPADCAVLYGNVVVNESNLTGEAMPIQKFPIERDANEFLDLERHGKKNILYAGTTVMQSTSCHTDYANAIIISTGASTTKGHMIREILYAPDVQFDLYDKLKYALALSCVMSLVSGIYMIWDSPHALSEMAVPCIFEAVACLSRMISPFTKVGFKMAQNKSAQRLGKNKIRCLNFQRIPMAGRVEVMCFDKTGTLTEEGLHLYGLQGVNNNPDRLSSTSKQSVLSSLRIGPYPRRLEKQKIDGSNGSSYQLLDVAIATCHTVTRMSDGSLAGNKVECELVNSYSNLEFRRDSDKDEYNPYNKSLKRGQLSYFIKAERDDTYKKNPSNKTSVTSVATQDAAGRPKKIQECLPVFKTVRQFEFDQKIQLQSVVVDIPEMKAYHVFAKGSPEKIRARCRPESLPDRFLEETQAISRDGFYLIAVACKRLDNSSLSLSNSTGTACGELELNREDMEKDLDFLGLIYFKNELKPCTISAIEDLQEGGVETRMITGDNVWNGLHIARKCGMIAPTAKRVLVANVEKKKQLRFGCDAGSGLTKKKNGDSQLVWQPEFCGSREKKLSHGIMLSDDSPILSLASKDHAQALAQVEDPEQTLGVTQTAFTYLQHEEPELLEKIFDRIVVFGGMNPAGKVDVVKRWSERCVVGMCGDGGNDCGALRTAHVGLALVAEHGSSEVSLVSPFSSSGPDPSLTERLDHGAPCNTSIRAIVDIIREGRCALENSMACFKFFVFYGLLVTVCKAILTPRETYLSEMAFLIQDAILVVLLTVFFFSYAMASCVPNGKLKNALPNHNVMGLQPWISILSLLSIQILLFTWILFDVEHFGNEQWYQPVDLLKLRILPTEWWSKNGSYLSGIALTVAVSANLQAAVIFSSGGAFRKPAYKNRYLMIVVGVTVAAFSSLVLQKNTWANCIVRMNCVNDASWSHQVPILESFMASGKEVMNTSFFFKMHPEPLNLLLAISQESTGNNKMTEDLHEDPYYRAAADIALREDSAFRDHVRKDFGAVAKDDERLLFEVRSVATRKPARQTGEVKQYAIVVDASKLDFVAKSKGVGNGSYIHALGIWIP